MDKRFFITVDWCNSGNRGIFCDDTGLPFSKEISHTQDEMLDILGPFWMILNPKSEQFSEEEIKEFNIFRPLAEYTNKYGIAIRRLP